MWIFSAKCRLIRALDSLALYNDKGISWSRHSPEQAEAERASRMARINLLIAKIDAEALPPELISAVRSGEVATDGTGRFVELLQSYAGRR